MNVDDIKTRLAQIGKAPSGSIPNSEQEAIIQRTLGNLPEFCFEVFRECGFQSDGRGETKGLSHYWVVPDKVRIDRKTGLCFLEQKSRQAFNLLTVWMAHNGIPLDDKSQCRDKVLIKRAITSLRSWCETIESQKAANGFNPEAYLLVLKEWVYDAVFQNGRIFFKGTSEQIREMMKAVDGDLFSGHPLFASRRGFLQFLESWQGDRNFFNVHMDKWGKKRVFTLALMP
jgi:hypothetical protein